MGNFGRLVRSCRAGIPDELMFILSGEDSHFSSVLHQFDSFKWGSDKQQRCIQSDGERCHA